jgi:ubiquinone/menaquinone biosynthesis C-methylase UbiE
MFKKRSQEKELLDGDNINQNDLFQNLRELDFINQHLGGYKITFSALDKIVQSGKTYKLVDIGSGGGDTLKRINNWRKKKSLQLQLYGVDYNPICVKYAQTVNKTEDVIFICDDYKNLFKHVSDVDIIHASLFCHHLNENELVQLLRFCATRGCTLVINDLERNPLAFYSIKLLTRLFSKSYLVKNDAPLSVLRGFKKNEWRLILDQAGAKNYSLKNKWAFRHQIIVYGTR